MIIYAGMPELGGHLPWAARAAAIPLMVSANRFAKGRKPGDWRRSTPDLDGSRVVLDSAGFVAMLLYGGYRWTPEQYADLAANLRPEWWASMDFCCEPELEMVTRERQEKTTAHLVLCRDAGDASGSGEPMPVIQGWHPEEYVRHAEEILALYSEPPGMIGIGSVCRRPLYGETGLLAVVDALDAALPPCVGCHLFGVKSAALPFLATCPRVASVDSMAWDFRARRSDERGVASRAAHLCRWYRNQVAFARTRRPFQRGLPF